MSVSHTPADTGRDITLLRAGELDEVQAFLERDPVRNLFMLSWSENYGVAAPGRPDLFHFRGVREQGRLVAVALIITDRLVLLDAVDDSAAAALGRWYDERDYLLEHLVSASRCIGPFWDAYSRDAEHPHIEARLDRNQQLYVLPRERWQSLSAQREERRIPGETRIAILRDLDTVFWASARMHTEETLEDPLEKNAAHFRRHVEHRIETERTFVWIDRHRRLLFKADISAQSRFGAQISGVYTPPSLRGRGLATRGMFDVCETLFERGLPRVTLYVNEENGAALRVYEKVGFEYNAAYRTVFVQERSSAH